MTGLALMMETELRLKTGTLVTRSSEEKIDAEHGEVRVVPVWRFLLETSDQGE